MMKKFRSEVAPAAHDEGEAELVSGTNKSDTIFTGGGPQHIVASNGRDLVHAGGGRDTVEAGNGKDEVSAGGGPDTVEGENGADFLFGAGGPDILIGGNGPDVLFGGVGPDTITGGRGPDVFVYASPGDSEHGEGGGDHGGCDDGQIASAEACADGGAGADAAETITDFKPGLDQFDVTALDLAGFSAGPSPLSAWVEQDGPDAILRIDTDGEVFGEHAAEISVILLGVNALDVSASDFLF